MRTGISEKNYVIDKLLIIVFVKKSIWHHETYNCFVRYIVNEIDE